MAEKVLLLAQSGGGKTTSLRNMNPEDSVVIQVVNKRLPFPEGRNWKSWTKTGEGVGEGSRIHLSTIPQIMGFIDVAIASGKKNIFIDDFVYLMANKVMADIGVTGFDKWNMLAADVYKLLNKPDTLPEDVFVVFMTHIEEDSNGNTKMKTAGKLIDNLLTPEGVFTTVLGASMKDGNYVFKTNKERNSEPYKSPMGMFESLTIPNDMKVVIDTQREYYGLTEGASE